MSNGPRSLPKEALVGVRVTARDPKVTGGMKRYAEEKGERLRRFFDGVQKVEFILDAEEVFCSSLVCSRC